MSALAAIQDLYTRFGQEEYGEAVTQIEHASQSAACALAEGSDEDVVVAAFLHDVGHLYGKIRGQEQMGVFGMVSHEELGADYLRSLGFPEKVAALVEGHVLAKRYFTFSEAGYYDKLSDASKATLVYQGGRMTADEAAAFEQSPWFQLSLRMRYWDDEAKAPETPIRDLQQVWDMIARVLAA
ncbi:MAG: HD domain-containing protein [Bacteroidia bacterium]